MKKRSLSLLLAFSIIFSLFTAISIPVYAMGESSFIAAGWGTTFYITKDGALWGFGKNSEGLMGNGTNEGYIAEPIKIMQDVKSVSVNRYAVMVVKKDGSLWYWGKAYNYQKVLAPTKILDGIDLVSMDNENQSILLVKNDGTLWEMSGLSKVLQQVPHGDKVKFIVTNGTNNFFINGKDELWGWNANKAKADGSLGVGHAGIVLEPVKIMNDVQSVACDNTNTMIIRKDATLWMCGLGHDGKFFDGTKDISGPVLSPIKIMDNVVHAASENNYFFAVKSDNTLWAWGNNDIKSLGSAHLSAPVKWADQVASITVGYQHKAIAKTDNTIWTGGRKDGVYHSTDNFQNELRQTAINLMDSPASWALAEVREAEYRKLVPVSMQSEYTKIVNRSEFCTLAITCIEQAQETTIEEYLTSKGIAIPTSTPFTDISSLSERARKDIMAAYALQIVAGTSATTFEPGNPITREQAAKMLTATAYALGEKTEATMPVFADGDNISNWAKPYIGYVFDANIMCGVGSNRFDPKGGYQRQQAYMTVLRVYKKVTGIE